jgi:hypothetical protein
VVDGGNDEVRPAEATHVVETQVVVGNDEAYAGGGNDEAYAGGDVVGDDEW